MIGSDALGVTVDAVDHAYETTKILHRASLDVAAGESLALLGPSGCGKTTLLRLIAGLERPSDGEIRIGDHTMADGDTWVPPEERRVGMVFQDWALFPHLSVGKNVGYGLPRAERKGERVDRALALVGLADLHDRMPTTLSGGQQQRVALARALAPEPAILLLDEPFSNLDTSLRVEVRSEVHRLLRDLGITAIYVTHDQEEAFVLGDRVALMRAGRIIQVDTPHGLYTTPADRSVAEFVGSGTILASIARDGLAATPYGAVPVHAADGAIDVLLRPEQLALVDGDDATVELVEYYGHDSMVFVRGAGHDEPLLRVRCPANPHVQRGDRVAVKFTGDFACAFGSESAGS